MTDASSRSVDRLREFVACVTHGRLVTDATPHASDETHLRFVRPAAIQATGALRGCSIGVRMAIEADGSVISYAFALLGPTATELLAWHWHPTPAFPAPVVPHLHVSAGLRISGPAGERGMVPLDKRHLPTGMVSLAAFVRMLIEEFGVEPLARDWEARLARA